MSRKCRSYDDAPVPQCVCGRFMAQENMYIYVLHVYMHLRHKKNAAFNWRCAVPVGMGCVSKAQIVRACMGERVCG